MFYTYVQVPHPETHVHSITDRLGHYIVLEADSSTEASKKIEEITETDKWAGWFNYQGTVQTLTVCGWESIESMFQARPVCNWDSGKGSKQAGKPWVIHVYYKDGRQETIVSKVEG